MSNKIMIKVENLKKEFRKAIKEPGLKGSFKALFKPKYDIVKAVDGISFDVCKGEIIGFIGPNGAGKSTVIKMLTGILKNSLFNYFVVGEKYEVVLSNFRRKIEILKAGVLLP